jgi:superfamily I DNA/RNA helicase
MSDIKYSTYQENLFEWIKNGTGNAVVEAIAGSGKSFSIVHALQFIPDKKRVLFLAFNKSTVNELQVKVKQSNVTIRTSHSLGYLMLKTHFKFQKETPSLNVDEYKYRNFFKQNFGEICEGIEFDTNAETEEFKEVVLTLTDLCRVYLCKTNEDIDEIADKYGYAITIDHINAIKYLIEWGQKYLDSIDYTDMICLPNYFNIILNSLKYDWVMVDEVQDQNIAMQQLFQRCIKKDGRFLGVGDRNQCLMTFAGADNQAFNKILNLPNTTKLDLSINYRCPQVVLPLAKNFVPQFQLREKAPLGKITYDVKVKDIKPNSMVICRNTAPLIELYLKLIQKNIKCYIKGIDIGANLIQIIERINVPYISLDMTKDGLIPILYKNLLEAREKLMVRRGLDINDATSERSIMQQLEIINTIKALSYNIKHTFELVDRIKEIFLTKANEDGICLITAHKAKGLEHDYVYLLCPSLIPSSFAKKDWEIEAENNLLYVIYTRTKNEFSTISETDFPPPQGGKDIKDILDHLTNISGCLMKIYGKNVIEDNDESSKPSKIFKIPLKSQKDGDEIKPLNIKKMEGEDEKINQQDKKVKSFEKLMLGKTVDECYDLFNDLGITNSIRVVNYNGKHCPITSDLIPDRINVHTENGKINQVKDFY